VQPSASHGDAHPLGPGHLRGPPATPPRISARPSLGDGEEAREGRRGAERRWGECTGGRGREGMSREEPE
jgi:hypothetical protein